ncbi:MAG: class I SAM-dependent methyltransferase [Acidobacteria bacterium]|nr:class I SAM-dependent methyltransferase [Acidobacteriota bacterium]
MGFYAKHILPHVIDLAMRNPAATRLRAEWIPRATGDVLEVGIGSGLNLPFYTNRVRRVYGLDPSAELQQMARSRAAAMPFEVEFMPQMAERPIPLPSGTIDTVVLTWTLCSVDDPGLTLAEIRRVLKTDGRLVFIEHGSAPDLRVRALQHRITPWWKRLAGGCHLNRQVRTVLSRTGFECVECQEGYLPGPRPLMFTYRGVAGRSGNMNG